MALLHMDAAPVQAAGRHAGITGPQRVLWVHAQDMHVLHPQERKLAAKARGWRDYYLATPSDAGVAAFWRWLSQHAGLRLIWLCHTLLYPFHTCKWSKVSVPLRPCPGPISRCRAFGGRPRMLTHMHGQHCPAGEWCPYAAVALRNGDFSCRRRCAVGRRRVAGAAAAAVSGGTAGPLRAAHQALPRLPEGGVFDSPFLWDQHLFDSCPMLILCCAVQSSQVFGNTGTM